MKKTGVQAIIKHKTDHLKPWQFKKGQSGNPSGRAPGISLKEYARQMLLTMSEKERQEYLHGLNKDEIWRMTEGNPQNDVTSGGEKIGINLITFDENNNDTSQPPTDQS